MLDWPFDFHYFEGDDAQREEQIMKHIINLPAATAVAGFLWFRQHQFDADGRGSPPITSKAKWQQAWHRGSSRMDERP